MNDAPNLPAALSAFRDGDLDRALALANALAAAAPSASVEHLLGLIHCRRGDMTAGLARLRAAVEAEPENPAFRVMLARALIDAGQADEVLAMAEPPRDGAAPSVALWHARAEAADAAGQSEAAIDAWQTVADARPSDWRAWSNLGNAQQALEQWPEAAASFRRAVALRPQEAQLRRNLAWALAVSGDLGSSAEQLRVAVRIEPDDVQTQVALARNLADLGLNDEALSAWDAAAGLTDKLPEGAVERAQVVVGRGRVLTAMTRFSEAEAVYRAAVDAFPTELAAWSELGLLLERTGQMDALRDLLQQAAGAGFGKSELPFLWATIALRDREPQQARDLLADADPGTDAVRWHRLQARIEDALGDSAAAFAAADAMHRAVPEYEAWTRKSAAYRRKMHSLAPLLTPEWGARLRPLPPPGRRSPVFLVGFPRSGTTLLDTFLMGHPGTMVLEEVHLLGAAETIAGDLAGLPDRSAGLLERARNAYFAELDRHVDPAFDGLVVDKMPLNMIGAPLINCLFPDSLVIFAQRHPCDAVLSGFMQSFVMNEAMACFLDIEAAADLYDAAMDVWMKSVEALPIRTQTLVYEQLVGDPAAALRPLLEALGLEWDEQMLDHRSTAKERGAIITPSYNQVTQPLSKAPIGRWKRYEEQLRPVLPVLLPWAKRLGYAD